MGARRRPNNVTKIKETSAKNDWCSAFLCRRHAASDVRFWHLADIDLGAENVTRNEWNKAMRAGEAYTFQAHGVGTITNKENTREERNDSPMSTLRGWR